MNNAHCNNNSRASAAFSTPWPRLDVVVVPGRSAAVFIVNLMFGELLRKTARPLSSRFARPIHTHLKNCDVVRRQRRRILPQLMVAAHWG